MSKLISLDNKIKSTLKSYLRGQLIIVLVVGVVFWAILSLLNVKHALFLGVISGFASFVPLFGISFTAIIASIVAYFDGVVSVFNKPIFDALAIFIIYIVVNQLIDWIIAPIIISKSVRLNPFIVIVSVMFGTLFFGLSGTILAVPMILMIKAIFEFHKEKKKCK